jgi:hypothetical protein
MKKLYLFIMVFIIQFVFHYTNGYTQDCTMKSKVEKITRIGKDSIVKLALDLITEDVQLDYFTKVKVMTDDKEIYVFFSNPIKYLPVFSEYYFDVNVNIIDKSVIYFPVSNPPELDSDVSVSFVQHTEEEESHINFVIDAMNKSNEVGFLDKNTFDDDMVIREKDNYYEVTIVSEYQESWCKIEKTSGRIFDIGHAHLVPPPAEKKSGFEEIK